MSDAAEAWDDLVATALLGSERRPVMLSAKPGRLGEALAALAQQSAERRLLGAAATLALYRRAGTRPAQSPEGPTGTWAPDASEDVPACTEAAARSLERMLQGEHADLLSEWLSALAGIGHRVPAWSLPDLLTLGQNRAELRALIERVAGRRGRWLAAQNPDWDYLLDADAAEVWQTGSRPARRALLVRLRAADPGRARELVEGTWATESAEDRAAFLMAFETGLSMADEPLLEAALDDRAKDVRQTAAALLASLPASRLVGRVANHLTPLLTLTEGRPGLLRRTPTFTIQVTLPEACDKTMVRDGIEPKSPSGSGERAWWLQQMMAIVPPGYWSKRWHKSAAQLLAMTSDNEWTQVLLAGWAKAAEVHRDEGWARAFLVAHTLQTDPPVWRLLKILAPDHRERVVLDLLESGRAIGEVGRPAFIQLLRGCQAPWSPELSRAALRHIQGSMTNGSPSESFWSMREILGELGQFLSPVIFEEVAAGWPDPLPGSMAYWSVQIDRLRTTLQFRHDMLEEISQ
jgi:hypothetical protein